MSNETMIAELLTKLRASSDDKEKRKIRSRLRSLGHRGGTGLPRDPGVRAAGRVSVPVIPPKPLDVAVLIGTRADKLTDEQLMTAMRHKDLERRSALEKKIVGEWNRRTFEKQKASTHKGLIDRRSQRELNLAERRIPVVKFEPVKNKGRRAKSQAIPIGSYTQPIDIGRLCAHCGMTKILIWGGDQDVAGDTVCPKCHPEKLLKHWPVKEVGKARDKLRAKNLNLGYAPDWGWFAYRRAKPHMGGFERIESGVDRGFYKTPGDVVSAVL